VKNVRLIYLSLNR